MDIAILGAGNIGGTLGKKWAQAGHRVMFGVRDAGSPKVLSVVQEAGGGASAGSLEVACAFGQVVLVAIPSSAVAAAVQAHGAALAGKLVIDATNKFGQPVINSVEDIAAHAPGARIYRAFNALGWENFKRPMIGGAQADLFYCGPEGEGLTQVERLVTQAGLRPIYVGGLDQVQVVDNLGALWVQLAFRKGMGRRIALKLISEDTE
jgi:predicted dinucleotide-binding enzyme